MVNNECGIYDRPDQIPYNCLVRMLMRAILSELEIHNDVTCIGCFND